MYCTKCKMQVEEQKFCSNCGKKSVELTSWWRVLSPIVSWPVCIYIVGVIAVIWLGPEDPKVANGAAGWLILAPFIGIGVSIYRYFERRSELVRVAEKRKKSAAVAVLEVGQRVRYTGPDATKLELASMAPDAVILDDVEPAFGSVISVGESTKVTWDAGEYRVFREFATNARGASVALDKGRRRVGPFTCVVDATDLTPVAKP